MALASSSMSPSSPTLSSNSLAVPSSTVTAPSHAVKAAVKGQVSPSRMTTDSVDVSSPNLMHSSSQHSTIKSPRQEDIVPPSYKPKKKRDANIAAASITSYFNPIKPKPKAKPAPNPKNGKKSKKVVKGTVKKEDTAPLPDIGTESVRPKSFAPCKTKRVTGDGGLMDYYKKLPAKPSKRAKIGDNATGSRPDISSDKKSSTLTNSEDNTGTHSSGKDQTEASGRRVVAGNNNHDNDITNNSKSQNDTNMLGPLDDPPSKPANSAISVKRGRTKKIKKEKDLTVATEKCTNTMAGDKVDALKEMPKQSEEPVCCVQEHANFSETHLDQDTGAALHNQESPSHKSNDLPEETKKETPQQDLNSSKGNLLSYYQRLSAKTTKDINLQETPKKNPTEKLSTKSESLTENKGGKVKDSKTEIIPEKANDSTKSGTPEHLIENLKSSVEATATVHSVSINSENIDSASSEIFDDKLRKMADQTVSCIKHTKKVGRPKGSKNKSKPSPRTEVNSLPITLASATERNPDVGNKCKYDKEPQRRRSRRISEKPKVDHMEQSEDSENEISSNEASKEKDRKRRKTGQNKKSKRNTEQRHTKKVGNAKDFFLTPAEKAAKQEKEIKDLKDFNELLRQQQLRDEREKAREWENKIREAWGQDASSSSKSLQSITSQLVRGRSTSTHRETFKNAVEAPYPTSQSSHVGVQKCAKTLSTSSCAALKYRDLLSLDTLVHNPITIEPLLEEGWRDNPECIRGTIIESNVNRPGIDETNTPQSNINMLKDKNSPVVNHYLECKKKTSPSESLWIDTYRPKSHLDVIGNKKQIKDLFVWLSKWKKILLPVSDSVVPSACKPKKRSKCNTNMDEDFILDDEKFENAIKNNVALSMLLKGKSGTGKTAAIYACARELDYKILEINSSDCRSGKQLISLFGEATQSRQVGGGGNGIDNDSKVLASESNSCKSASHQNRNVKKSNAEKGTIMNFFLDRKSNLSSTKSGKRKRAFPAEPILNKKLVQGQHENTEKVIMKAAASKDKKRRRVTKKESTAGIKRSKNTDSSPDISSTRKKNASKKIGEPKKIPEPEKRYGSDDGGNSSLKLMGASLIVIEDIDVIFEEDQGFWRALRNLMCDSKVPIVMTCNSDDPYIDKQVREMLDIKNFFRPKESELLLHIQALLAVENIKVMNVPEISAFIELMDRDIRSIFLNLQLWSGSVQSCHNSKLLHSMIGFMKTDWESMKNHAGYLYNMRKCSSHFRRDSIELLNHSHELSRKMLRARAADMKEAIVTPIRGENVNEKVCIDMAGLDVMAEYCDILANCDVLQAHRRGNESDLVFGTKILTDLASTSQVRGFLNSKEKFHSQQKHYSAQIPGLVQRLKRNHAEKQQKNCYSPTGVIYSPAAMAAECRFTSTAASYEATIEVEIAKAPVSLQKRSPPNIYLRACTDEEQTDKTLKSKLTATKFVIDPSRVARRIYSTGKL
eukprot:UC4_evm2s1428